MKAEGMRNLTPILSVLKPSKVLNMEVPASAMDFSHSPSSSPESHEEEFSESSPMSTPTPPRLSHSPSSRLSPLPNLPIISPQPPSRMSPRSPSSRMSPSVSPRLSPSLFPCSSSPRSFSLEDLTFSLSQLQQGQQMGGSDSPLHSQYLDRLRDLVPGISKDLPNLQLVTAVIDYIKLLQDELATSPKDPNNNNNFSNNNLFNFADINQNYTEPNKNTYQPINNFTFGDISQSCVDTKSGKASMANSNFEGLNRISSASNNVNQSSIISYNYQENNSNSFVNRSNADDHMVSSNDMCNSAFAHHVANTNHQWCRLTQQNQGVAYGPEYPPNYSMGNMCNNIQPQYLNNASVIPQNASSITTPNIIPQNLSAHNSQSAAITTASHQMQCAGSDPCAIKSDLAVPSQMVPSSPAVEHHMSLHPLHTYKNPLIINPTPTGISLASLSPMEGPSIFPFPPPPSPRAVKAARKRKLMLRKDQHGSAPLS